MIDGMTEDTGDASLEAAGAAIAGLLSETEDKQEREAPPRKKPVTAPAAPEDEGEQDETETEGAAAQPEEEVEPEEPEDDTEATKPEPRKLRVKVDGEELELPEDEVVKGYSRTADYTRKTQKLAEEARAFEAERAAVTAERQRYATQLSQLEQVLKDATPAEPDWDTLRNGDPAVFAATYAAWDQHQKSIERVSAERQKAEQKVQADRQAAHAAALESEKAKLLAAIPAWSDPEVAKREKADLLAYASEQGYAPEEINGITDHRVIKILRDAAAHRAALKKGPTIERKIEKAKTMAPGANTTPPERVSELTKAKQALAKTHSLNDAGRAINLLLGNV